MATKTYQADEGHFKKTKIENQKAASHGPGGSYRAVASLIYYIITLAGISFEQIESSARQPGVLEGVKRTASHSAQ